MTRGHYRPTAIRASILYFINNSLDSINPIYQFSLNVKIYLDDVVSKCKGQNSASSSDAQYISYYFYQMFTFAGLCV